MTVDTDRTDLETDINLVTEYGEQDVSELPAKPVDPDIVAERKDKSGLLIPALIGGIVFGICASLASSYIFRADEPDMAPMQAEIASLEREVAALKARPAPVAAEPVDLSGLQRRIGALEARPAAEQAAVAPDIDPLVQRLDALEAAAPPELDEDLVARLENLQAEGLDFDMPELGELRSAIDALSDRVSEVESRPSPVAELDALRARIDDLQSQAQAPVVFSPPVSTSTIVIDPDSLPRFPADRLREGAAEAAGEGFIRRSLSRHVRVKDEGSEEVLIGEVEDALAAGDVRAAVAAFDRLPEGIRNLARGWRAEMEELIP